MHSFRGFSECLQCYNITRKQYNCPLIVVLSNSEQRSKIPIMLPLHMFLKVMAVAMKFITDRALYVLNLGKRPSKFWVTIKTRGIEKILAPFYFLPPLFLMIPLEAFYWQLLNHTCHLGVWKIFSASNNCFPPNFGLKQPF